MSETASDMNETVVTSGQEDIGAAILALPSQAYRVLAHLRRYCSDSAHGISRCLDVPEASVRRSIQELIHAGFNVTYASHSGIYTYTEAQ